jgi:aminoglycoside phosphotransferase (APT) family kinase protein
MERVEGDVLRSDEPSWVDSPARRERIGYELVETVSRIHAVDYETVSLGDIGRPAGYTERQVDRWRRQLEWAFEVTADDRLVPVLHRVGDWLRDNVPDTPAHTLVPGDFALDNVLYAPGDDPEIGAVLDWEMSTLGDPSLDLAWILVHWRDLGDPAPAVPELTPTFTDAEGYPTRTDLVARYERESGNRFRHHRFYRTLAVYKLAALGEMFYRRHLEGNADDPVYPAMADSVPRLAERARRIIDGEGPL